MTVFDGSHRAQFQRFIPTPNADFSLHLCCIWIQELWQGFPSYDVYGSPIDSPAVTDFVVRERNAIRRDCFRLIVLNCSIAFGLVSVLFQNISDKSLQLIADNYQQLECLNLTR
ncbi:hypothetical protein RHMOL_Rhmol06G0177100 [Rhododendron molle]|uniref:Uncharacterized protein n=1 Tax=Rhododendron molle TaxID=49168 RepID=A0ACC0NDN8_RHOML|nr:hypothetical protein RHMOL_Rhmol06G0177100 [Rhododendron molle]